MGGTPPGFLPQFDGELGDFIGPDVNGAWKLFMVSSDGEAPAALEDGWALSFITAPYPEITNVTIDSNQQVHLTFLGVPGGIYQLQGSGDLHPPFGIMQEKLVSLGAYTELVFPKPPGNAHYFFRIEETSIPPLESFE
jgi:hypothetical protein